jgi:hypothetical protein
MTGFGLNGADARLKPPPSPSPTSSAPAMTRIGWWIAGRRSTVSCSRIAAQQAT